MSATRYEHSVIHDVLRSLAEEGLPGDTVIFHDGDGAPVRASEILASMDGDGVLADGFAVELAKAVIFSLERHTRPAQVALRLYWAHGETCTTCQMDHSSLCEEGRALRKAWQGALQAEGTSVGVGR